MNRPSLLAITFACFTFANIGCGGSTFKMSSAIDAEQEKAPAGKRDDGKAGGEGQKNAPPAGRKVERKIIYTAQILLYVENVDDTRAKLMKEIKQYKAYIQSADIQGSLGTRRRATWTIRVPVENFDGLRAALLPLGEPQQDSVNSEEVTEQYYDLQKRISNEKKYEERLLLLLKKDTKDLKDVIQVEEKLSIVRGKIEVMEGQLNRLRDRTSLSTITLTAIERGDYVPPQTASFGTTISRTFNSSVQSLVDVGKAIVLVAVAITPWLPVFGMAALLIWWLTRRARTSSGRKTAKSEAPTESL